MLVCIFPIKSSDFSLFLGRKGGNIFGRVDVPLASNKLPPENSAAFLEYLTQLLESTEFTPDLKLNSSSNLGSILSERIGESEKDSKNNLQFLDEIALIHETALKLDQNHKSIKGHKSELQNSQHYIGNDETDKSLDKLFDEGDSPVVEDDLPHIAAVGTTFFEKLGTGAEIALTVYDDLHEMAR